MHTSGGWAKEVKHDNSTPREGEWKTITLLYTLRDGELKAINQLCTLRGGELNAITE